MLLEIINESLFCTILFTVRKVIKKKGEVRDNIIDVKADEKNIERKIAL